MLGTQHRSCLKDNRSTQFGSLCAVICGHPHKREVRKKKNVWLWFFVFSYLWIFISADVVSADVVVCERAAWWVQEQQGESTTFRLSGSG